MKRGGPKEHERLIEQLYAQGVPGRKIAELFGLDTRYLETWMNKRGIHGTREARHERLLERAKQKLQKQA